MTSTDSLAGLGRLTVAEAASELTRACQAAGLKIQVSPSPSKAGFGRYLVLGEVTPQTAVRLAELIEEQLTEAHQVAEELWNTFQACGLTTSTPYVVDSRKCISYATIELRDETLPAEIAENLNGWLYGCDICQDVCPWNRFEQPTAEARFEPRRGETSLSLDSVDRMKHEEYVERFRGSAMKRTKLSGLKRNAKHLKG